MYGQGLIFTPADKLSEYNEMMQEEQLKNITEIKTVLDTPPEAKRY